MAWQWEVAAAGLGADHLLIDRDCTVLILLSGCALQISKNKIGMNKRGRRILEKLEFQITMLT